jgi:hypothetical protein
MLLRALARRGVGDGMLCTHLSGVPQCEMWEDSGTHPRSARDAFPVGSGLWFRESQERLCTRRVGDRVTLMGEGCEESGR